jgi:hypothetical protein
MRSYRSERKNRSLGVDERPVGQTMIFMRGAACPEVGRVTDMAIYFVCSTESRPMAGRAQLLLRAACNRDVLTTVTRPWTRLSGSKCPDGRSQINT